MSFNPNSLYITKTAFYNLIHLIVVKKKQQKDIKGILVFSQRFITLVIKERKRNTLGIPFKSICSQR